MNPPLKFIRDNWVIVVFFVTMVMAFANFQNADVKATEQIGVLEISMDRSNDARQAIQVQLAQIQADINWIRKSLQAK